MVGRFAGEVTTVEFFERGIDVVGIERDMCSDPIVGVDLDNIEHLGMEGLGPLVATRHSGTT